MQFRFSGGKPVYLQIVEQFRDAVLSGEYAPGQRVPSVRELAAQAKVNPNTMQRALSALEQEQLLVCNGTAGRFVTQDTGVLQALRERAIHTLVEEYRKRMEELGVSGKEAIRLLLEEEPS